MILRLSAKLGKKVHSPPVRVLPVDENPYADWSAHVFTADRAQYILVSNTVSLYSLVFFGKGITRDHHLITRFTTQLREHLDDDGLPFIYERLIMPETNRVTIAKSANRSVIGSMNDLVACAKFLLTEHDFAPYDLAGKLNDMPMSHINDSPMRALRKLSPV